VSGRVRLTMWPHYEIGHVESMAELREMFVEATNYELNWLFCSTSGVHGTRTTLDEIERAFDLPSDHDEYVEPDITVLVVQPRLVVLRYGHVWITREDVPWLREVVAKSLAGVLASQEGNISPLTPSGEQS
jgi:hypothetical protein